MFTKEETELLRRLARGEFDGPVGKEFLTDGGSTVWFEIVKGIPQKLKQGPGGKYFNGKENVRFEGVLKTLEKWVTDEQKMDFFKKYGWLIKDALANAYSAKFKSKK